MYINAVCEKTEQAEAVSAVEGIARVYSPNNTMPYVFRNNDAKKCGHFLEQEYLLVRNLDEIGYLKENDYKGEIVADHTLYTYNKLSREMLKESGVIYDTAPLELTFHELKSRGMDKTELMVYGRIPMMISAGCVYRNSNNDKCYKNTSEGQGQLVGGDMKHELDLTDRMKVNFPVICDCEYCYNIILNSVPLSLHNEFDKVLSLSPGSVRLYFTTETPDEARRIAEYFVQLINGNANTLQPYQSYTKGHFLHGVV